MQKQYPTIIGLHSPNPGSGKTTIATQMIADRQVRVHSIAGRVRDMAIREGFAVAAFAQGEDKDKPHPLLGGLTPRQKLIEIGKRDRDLYGEDIWCIRLLDWIAEKIPSDAIVAIDDVRLECEAVLIEAAGGKIVTLTRKAAKPNPDDINSVTPRVIVPNEDIPPVVSLAVWEAAFGRG
jgi:hypothetical protein